MAFGPTGAPPRRTVMSNSYAGPARDPKASAVLFREQMARAMSGDGPVGIADERSDRRGPNLLSPREFLLSEARNLRTWATNSDSHAKEYPGVADDMKRRAITLRGAAAEFEAAAALIPVVE